MAKNFEAIDISRVADSCVKCGQCLPHCPTYRLASHETQSPRGRLDLLKMAAAASSDTPESALDAIEDCLACGQCERHCPLQLPITAAIAAHRAAHDPGRSMVERTLAHSWAFGTGVTMLRLMPDAVLGHLPGADLLHTIKHRTRSWQHKEDQDAPPQAWVLPGCTGHSLEGDTLDALIKLADHLDIKLQVLPPQCCGSLAAHRGHLHQASSDSSRLRSLAPTPSEAPLIHLNTGCHDRMSQSLPHHQVLDAIEWLYRHRARLRWRAAPDQAVALHWPCTSDASHRLALLGLLADIPGLSVRELNEHAGCCGAAGDHFLRQPERALAFRANWMNHWLLEPMPIVLGSNIGCAMFLGADPRFSATIQHPLVFLASQLETLP